MKVKNILYLGIMLLTAACGSHHQETEPAVVADEGSVTAFAQQIEQSVLNGNPDVYNNAFDREYLKSLIRDNSIVNSSLDTDFGQEYFESNFHLGDKAVQIVDEGGDFKFVRYYLDASDSTHHVIFRTYDRFINFYDYTIDTVGGELAIKDGFIYLNGQKFSDDIRENMYLNVLHKTNPEGITSTLEDIKQLLYYGKNREAIQLMRENETEFSDFSCYWQLYISGLYQTYPKKQFINSLKQLGDKGIDQRMILLHQMMFYLNEGMPEANDSIISQLIEYAGDDPIFLLIFGQTNYNAKQYETALGCYETADEYLPPLWDLWYGKLECYDKLNETERFNQCLEAGKKNYGMTDEELMTLKKNRFPGQK